MSKRCGQAAITQPQDEPVSDADRAPVNVHSGPARNDAFKVRGERRNSALAPLEASLIRPTEDRPLVSEETSYHSHLPAFSGPLLLSLIVSFGPLVVFACFFPGVYYILFYILFFNDKNSNKKE